MLACWAHNQSCAVMVEAGLWRASRPIDAHVLLFSNVIMDELIGLCIKRAARLLPDSIDGSPWGCRIFCRYYAVEAKRLDPANRLQSRGVVSLYQSLDFPLAIFMGQIAAALVAGKLPSCKPAEQTSLIANVALELMISVGLPEDTVNIVLQCVPDVGMYFYLDDAFNASCFTGSRKQARSRSQILAARGTGTSSMIAETGGQNCMIVTQTATSGSRLVDDVVTSGFQSAGQLLFSSKSSCLYKKISLIC